MQCKPYSAMYMHKNGKYTVVLRYLSKHHADNNNNKKRPKKSKYIW